MKKHSEEFANCAIEIDKDSNLTIQKKPIEYTYDGDTKTWSSHFLPYTSYPSLIELARAIAGDTSEFVDTNN